MSLPKPKAPHGGLRDYALRNPRKGWCLSVCRICDSRVKLPDPSNWPEGMASAPPQTICLYCQQDHNFPGLFSSEHPNGTQRQRTREEINRAVEARRAKRVARKARRKAG